MAKEPLVLPHVGLDSKELAKLQEKHPGYWPGSAAGETNYWRDRALAAEARERELRQRLDELALAKKADAT